MIKQGVDAGQSLHIISLSEDNDIISIDQMDDIKIGLGSPEEHATLGGH